MTPLPLVLNVVTTQAAWFASVLGAAHGRTWVGPAAVGLAVAIHAPAVTWTDWRLGLFAAALAMGAVVDSALAWSGLVAYAGATVLAPPWILCLWINLAIMLGGCLAWLRRMPWWVCALIGCAAGPGAYVGGEGLGALTFPHGRLTALAALALAWSICLPLLVRIQPSPGSAHA